MNDALLRFGDWLQNSPMGLTVGQTLWGYPYIQLIHFFGLSLWVGTIVMLDLRILGLAVKNQSATQLLRNLLPWTWTGLCIVVTGGVLLFSAAAKTYMLNAAFRVKFPLLLTGIAYHIFIQQKLPKWESPAGLPAVAKIAGFTELVLWIGVITAAVNIPNY